MVDLVVSAFVVAVATYELVMELRTSRRRSCLCRARRFFLALGDGAVIAAWSWAAARFWLGGQWTPFWSCVYGVAVLAWLLWLTSAGSGSGRRIGQRLLAQVRAAGARLAVVPVAEGSQSA